MQNAIRNEIKRLSKRAFARELRLTETEQKYQSQFTKRTGLVAGIAAPASVAKHKHFDPSYCARNANFLAKTIWHKVLEKSYEPQPAIQYSIPKPDGGSRTIMAFSIPDAALANIVLRRSRGRNIKRLSPSSYAYHPDKNVFDAILALQEYEAGGKLFAVQIDFEKYFDNIPNWYLNKKINEGDKISLTPHENYVYSRFLRHRYANLRSYRNNRFSRRWNGTPQGSSLSLLLANLANHDLDTALTAAPGKFVRFADDVVALCSNYGQAQEIERCFYDHCKLSGLTLNQQKSLGVAIISPNNEEMRTYPYFDYLGYRFLSDGLSIPEKVEKRIKSRISNLINIYLLQYLSFGFNHTRCALNPHQFDWDLLGLIYELRNSLYGGLSENEIRSFLSNGDKLRRMRGLMGFYCLLDDHAVLRRLDGWMLSAVRRAMVSRSKVLRQRYGANCPTPNNRQLATGDWLDLAAWREGDPPDPRMPSFVRGWRASKKYFLTFGLEHVEAPRYASYSDVSTLFDY